MKLEEFTTTFRTYKPVDQVGEGGSGRVFKVIDTDGQQYAIKLLDLKRVSDEKRKRFKNEIVFCSKNQHANILSVIDYGLQNGAPFYVMEYYSKTLRSLLKEAVGPEICMKIFYNILDGVEAAHWSSVWHRDLKPENILYDSSKQCAIVADFGIARFTEDLMITNVETRKDSRLANFQYAAPEQRKPGGTIDQRTDIYSLGLILNEMFTHDVIQGSGYKTIGSVSPQYAYLDPVVDLMVRQDANDRPPSVSEVKRLLSLYGNEFIAQQRISKLDKTVIREHEIDDPLVVDPVRVIDRDLSDNMMIFRLNHDVSKYRDWVECFRNQQGYEMYPGEFQPNLFNFSGQEAMIKTFKADQKRIEMFKTYVANANNAYRMKKLTEEKKRVDEEQRLLSEKKAIEKKRLEFLQNTKL